MTEPQESKIPVSELVKVDVNAAVFPVAVSDFHRSFMNDIATASRIPLRYLGNDAPTMASGCFDQEYYDRQSQAYYEHINAWVEPLIQRVIDTFKSLVNRAMLRRSRAVKPWKHRGRRRLP
jgi:hypothetical protein